MTDRVVRFPAVGLLDVNLIRARRIQLRLSERTLAKHLGVTGSVIYGLERGTNHADLPLGLVVKLAEVLAVTLDELGGYTGGAAEPRQEASKAEDLSGGVVVVVDEDVRRVGALLAGDGRLVPVTALAYACNWTLGRTERVLAALAQRLPMAGMRLHRLAGDVGIVPAATPTAETQTLGRQIIARRGLNLRQAQLLHRIASGEVIDASGNADRVALASLVNAGLVQHGAGDRRGGAPTLSDDAAFSVTPGSNPRPDLGSTQGHSPCR